ncbi:MAG: hypothetical protein MMC33_007091, partial [Icmadophila ericetorum]|nr:hypothetical protein [Icmadophila ericetorum]
MANHARISSQRFFELSACGQLDGKSVVQALVKDFHMKSMATDPYLKALKAFSSAATLYKDMPSASIDI